MRNKTKAIKLLSLVLALIFGVSSAFFAFASGEESKIEGSSEPAASQSIITGYDLSEGLTQITKDSVFDLTVYIRNLKLKTDRIEDIERDIEITKTRDSFRDGRITYKVTSKGNGLLTYEIHFEQLKYTGRGRELNFLVTYNGTDCETEELTLTVDECVEYVSETPTVKEIPAPTVEISRDEISGAIKAGQGFSVNITVKNTSSTPIINATAILESSDGLILNESKASKRIGAIAPGEEATIRINLKADKEISTSSAVLPVLIKYTYETGTGVTECSADEKILIPVVAAERKDEPTKTAAATPNIIITEYSFGGASVASGEKFKLVISFKNTSKQIAIENIVMSVMTGENLSITSSSNTVYIPSIKPGEIKKQSIEMQVLPNAVSTGAKTDISFSYEYVVNGDRTSTTSNESLSIPVYLPDRFTVSEPQTIFATAGSEVTLSFPYINKGKGEISNVETELIFDNSDYASLEEPKQNLGNFEAGKSGTIDYFFTPNMSGEISFKLVVSYEDEMMQQKKIEIPVKMTVEEQQDNGDYIEPMPMPEGDEESGNGAIIGIIIGAVALAAVIATIIAVKKKKKKKAAEIPEDFNWEDDKETKQE